MRWLTSIVPIVFLIPLAGCSPVNLIRRSVNVEPRPSKVDISGTPIVASEMPPISNQHPATRLFYMDDNLKPGCIEIPGRDLNKAHKKIQPFGTFTAKRRWPQATQFGMDCPIVVSWRGKPEKTKAVKVDEDAWKAFVWTEARRQILLLAPAQIRILGDQFWPKEIPPELEGVFSSRQSSVSAPPTPEPAVHLRPVLIPAEGLTEQEMILDGMSPDELKEWYLSLSPEERIGFHEMIRGVAMIVPSVPDERRVSMASTEPPSFADQWPVINGEDVHLTIDVNAPRVKKEDRR